MKFSLSIAVLFSAAMLVQASVYETVFTNHTTAVHCLISNAAYLKKVSDSQNVVGRTLILENSEACDSVIFEEITDVCGSVLTNTCMAPMYEIVFDSPADAKNCLTTNAAYINKVSKSQKIEGEKLVLYDDAATCNYVIFQEIVAVCGNVVSDKCAFAAN